MFRRCSITSGNEFEVASQNPTMSCTMTAMALGGPVREQGQPVEVVILTVIPAELKAVYRVLQIDHKSREKAPDGTVYFRGAVRSGLVGRDYIVALTCIGSAGTAGAAAATAGAITRYGPRAVLLAGIAAGIRDKIRIGEVVLSDRVVAYESAALTRSANGATVHPRPEIDRAPHTMIQDAVSYRPEPARLQHAFERAGGVIPSAPDSSEHEFRSHVASTITARLGTIASGEKLLRDPAKLLAVRKLHDKVEVGEMEAAGIVDGCRRGAVPWLVIRGISDFGDQLKDDRFHAFASCAAAAVLCDFLAYGLDLGGTSDVAGRGHPHAAHPLPADNPFVFGRAIDRDEDFVGRVDEQHWLRDAIVKRQPVELLGERLMGKTSLLRWMERSLYLDRPVIWLDPSRGVTPMSIVQSIARALRKPEAATVLDRLDATADQAGKVLDALVPFVLLVDDADALYSRGQGFEDGFFEALRALVQRGDLIWISASRYSLYEKFKVKGLTSRFLNDALRITVGPLSKAAAVELALRGQGPDMATRMVATAGGFAYGLQWLGDFVCRRPGQLEQAFDAFADEVVSTFRSWWAGMDVHERQLAKRCLLGHVRVVGLDSTSRRRLRGLRERGLVAEQEGRFLIEGEAWRSFVADAD
jgi:nucleoside phosphorylase